jgi:hypothetical protein
MHKLPLKMLLGAFGQRIHLTLLHLPLSSLLLLVEDALVALVVYM